MQISLFEMRVLADVGAVIANAARAEEQGFATYWIPQTGFTDALIDIAVSGRSTTRIGLGTAVIPTYPRHPSALASQALTAQAACGGRLTLGIGLSHQPVVEGAWGYSFARPVGHMREYLEILLPLLRGEAVDLKGEHWTCVGRVEVSGAAPPPVLLAALGSQMLGLAGRLADGTITWCTGHATLAGHVVPRLREAAAAAGRPDPRVVAGLPVCVTDDPTAVRARVARVLAGYDLLPSYRSMLDIEGVEGPADIAIIGDEDEVGERLDALATAGVTELNASVTPRNRDEGDRTVAFLSSLTAR